MRVQMNAVRFKADKKLIQLIEKKLQKLEQLFSKIINAEVFLKLENSGKIKEKIAEIKLKVPGDTLIVKGSSKTFEEAIDQTIKTMIRILKRYKQKRLNIG